MRFSRKILYIAASTAVATAVLVSWATAQSPAPPSPAKASSGRIAGKPDFSGIWEASNTANWDLLTHESRPMVGQQGLTANSVVLAAPVLALGSIGWVPPGLGVVDGNE